MIQEIIAYIIVGVAITLAFMKIRERFATKKGRRFKRRGKYKASGNCSSCSAECMLRNAPPQTIENNKNLCKEIKIEGNLH